VLAASTAAAQQAADLDATAGMLVEMTNRLRGEERLSQQTVNEKLQTTALDFAAYMAKHDKYGHEADGQKIADRIQTEGYEHCLVAENIAYQFSTRVLTTATLSERFFDGWINSMGHRANMLDPDMTETGVGLAQSKKTGRYYAVQLFGRPRSAGIEFDLVNGTPGEIEYDLDGGTFTLKPRFSRTHRQCRAGEVVIRTVGESKVNSIRLQPQAGERLKVVQQNASLKVERE
jgi:hypothetical protein